MASPREGFFETNPAMTIGANLTGTLNAIAAAATAVVGAATTFTTELAVGDIISFIDTAGERQFYTISVITDNLNLTLAQPARTASGGGTSYGIATNSTNYIITRDAINLTYPLGDPVLGRIGGGLTSGYRMNAPSISGVNLVDSISEDEGIRINTIYLRNPYQHTWADRSFMVSFYQVADGTGNQTLITQLGVNGLLYITGENAEIDVNVYIPPLTARWGLAALISNSQTDQNTLGSTVENQLFARMSNVNVPTSMDGLLLPIVIGCRFTYGLTITAA